MLRSPVESVDAKAEAEGFGVAPCSSEQLEIVLREQKNFEVEAVVLERYAEVATRSSRRARASSRFLLRKARLDGPYESL